MQLAELPDESNRRMMRAIQYSTLVVSLAAGFLIFAASADIASPAASLAEAAEVRIKGYYESGAPDAPARMRHELLDATIERSEAIRIASGYLDAAGPDARYAAADILYILGDRRGGPVLVALVNEPSAVRIPNLPDDLRKMAAMKLAEYRDQIGGEAVARLYASTGDPDVRRFACALGVREIIPRLLADMKKKVWINQFEECALVGAMEARPQIQAEFENSENTVRMRAAAAAAMLRLGEKEPYIPYLTELLNRCIPGAEKEIEQAASEGMCAFGGMHDLRIRAALENALSAPHSRISRRALVQLNVNYPESVQGRQTLIDLLKNGGATHNTSDLFRLAAMSSFADVRLAAESGNPTLWQHALSKADWDHGPWLRAAGAR